MGPWALLAAAWRHRRAIAEAVELVEDSIAGSTDERSQPLAYKDNEHIRRQIAQAIAHKVKPIEPAPVDPSFAVSVDREAPTPRPRPPIPPRKRSQ